MFLRRLGAVSASLLVLFSPLLAQDASPTSDVHIPLQVPAGTPLRLYIVRRAWFHQNEVIEARFVEPVWAFDRIVIPAGSSVEGTLTELQPVPKMTRTMAILRGDFTPLKEARVTFTSIALPGRAPLPIDTQPSVGLKSIYVPPRPAKPGKAPKPKYDPNSKMGRFRAFVTQQAQSSASARSRGVVDLVRSPNRREWLENFLWAKLPYHPQFYRSRTRFDAVLNQPVDFGTADLSAASLKDVGTSPALDASIPIRFLSTVDSHDAKVGDPVEAVLSQPLLSADHRLVLPEGAHLTGKVTLARPARLFHRGGQLRFAFNNIQPPKMPGLPDMPHSMRTQAQLSGAESDVGPMKVDGEGTARTTESKTRFFRPAIATLVATRSLDNDSGKTGASGSGDPNASGRSLGGFSGFGLLGTAVRYAPRAIGSGFAFYGLAWSVYSTVVARGQEVVFEKNSAMAVRFGVPPRHK